MIWIGERRLIQVLIVAPEVVMSDFSACVFQRREHLTFIEAFHVQAVLAFDSSVVLRGADTDAAVRNAQFDERQIKACRLFALLPEERVGKLVTVVGLRH